MSKRVDELKAAIMDSELLGSGRPEWLTTSAVARAIGVSWRRANTALLALEADGLAYCERDRNMPSFPRHWNDWNLTEKGWEINDEPES